LSDLKEVGDGFFSTGIMGEGVAIIPFDNVIYAPCDGYVSVVYQTKHAIGIINKQGVEILIHLGIDTARLDGKYFKTFVNSHEEIVSGQKLAYFEYDIIRGEGYNPCVLLIVTNKNHKTCQVLENKRVSINDTVIVMN
jgi:glucose-specific phosphotransferase system IIA component